MGLISRELHISDVVLHKNFNFTTQVNDIALLKTSELQQKIPHPVSAGEQVDLESFPPVCLPSLEQSFSGLEGTVAGDYYSKPCLA